MRAKRIVHAVCCALCIAIDLPAAQTGALDEFAAALPDRVTAVWDSTKAYRETTPTRGKICINGLWRWQPVLSSGNEPESLSDKEVPHSGWGYFKVPGCWPG